VRLSTGRVFLPFPWAFLGYVSLLVNQDSVFDRFGNFLLYNLLFLSLWIKWILFFGGLHLELITWIRNPVHFVPRLFGAWASIWLTVLPDRTNLTNST
jgi:hypothetical protein